MRRPPGQQLKTRAMEIGLRACGSPRERGPPVGALCDLTKRHFMMSRPPAREVIQLYPRAAKGFSYEYPLGEMSMRRRILFIVTLPMVLSGFVMAAPAALAASPHFIGTPSCTKSVTTGLTCSGKAAGLGDEPAFVFLSASSVTANYVCVNKGGNIAPGQPVVTQDVTGPSQEIAPHNGQITFSATLPVPAPPSAATECPNGNWTVHLTSLTYSNVVLHIQEPLGVEILSFNFGTIDP
jgi:hypothetical protein